MGIINLIKSLFFASYALGTLSDSNFFSRLHHSYALHEQIGMLVWEFINASMPAPFLSKPFLFVKRESNLAFLLDI